LKGEQQESDLAFEILNTKFIEDVNGNVNKDETELNTALFLEENHHLNKQEEEEIDKSNFETLDLLRSAVSILNSNFNPSFDEFELDFDPTNYKKHLFIETSTPANEQDFIAYNFNLGKVSGDNENFYKLEYFDLFGFCLNDYVSINDKKYGILKFIGNVHFKHGIFCGLELDEPDGKHDGKIDNIRSVQIYFFYFRMWNFHAK